MAVRAWKSRDTPMTSLPVLPRNISVMPGANRVGGTGPKLALVCGVIISITIYLASVGASADWQYYLTTDECLNQADSLIGDRLRVSGKIATGSLEVATDRRSATFQLVGHGQTLAVTSVCLVPDNLAEEREVVVEGLLENSRSMRADKLITRCASKYESRAATDVLAGSTERADPRR